MKTWTTPLGNGLLSEKAPVKTSGVAGALQGALPVLKNVFPSPFALKQVAFHVVEEENPSVLSPALPTFSVLGP